MGLLVVCKRGSKHKPDGHTNPSFTSSEYNFQSFIRRSSPLPPGSEAEAPVPFGSSEWLDGPIPADEGHGLSCRKILGKNPGGSGTGAGKRSPPQKEDKKKKRKKTQQHKHQISKLGKMKPKTQAPISSSLKVGDSSSRKETQGNWNDEGPIKRGGPLIGSRFLQGVLESSLRLSLFPTIAGRG